MTEQPYGDALTRPFWQAAAEHRLIIQHCRDCGQYQFYPRPFCLNCQSDAVEWLNAAGSGEIYSITTVRMPVQPDMPPPYQVAIVQLDEGPRLYGGLVGAEGRIGDRVGVRWKERAELPPLPMFEVIGRTP